MTDNSNPSGTIKKYLVRLMLAFGIVTVLSGCGALESGKRIFIKSGPDLSAATLPRYIVGETFTFDDGRTETVLEVHGEMVTWRTDRGAVIRGYRNFLIPPAGWQTGSRRSRTKISAAPNMLWPLAVGNTQSFDLRQIVETNAGKKIADYARTWKCVVVDTENVSVAAGKFDTFVISCFRYNAGTTRWRQTRRYYYAPEIGHYVLREDTYISRPSKRRELVSRGFNSTVLPESEQAALNRGAQKAFSRNPDGKTTVWKSADGKLSVGITPTRSYKNVTGVTCREYASVYRYQGRERSNFRNVCRQANGHWQRAPMPSFPNQSKG